VNFDNPDDEKHGKELKGDPIGTNLYNMQVTTKALIRPQHWFFNVVLTRPSTKYFREAESNGLHYQIHKLEDKLERDYHRNVDNYYDEKLVAVERKLQNNLQAKKDFRAPKDVYSQKGDHYPIYLKSFIELKNKQEQNLGKVNLKDDAKNGPLSLDQEIIDHIDDIKSFMN